MRPHCALANAQRCRGFWYAAHLDNGEQHTQLARRELERFRNDFGRRRRLQGRAVFCTNSAATAAYLVPALCLAPDVSGSRWAT
jgi:hypothetical protein